MACWRWSCLVVALVLGAVSPAVQPSEAGEPRTALVIGNATYQSAPLRNPVNDARAMAKTLTGMGFDVLIHENANEKTLKQAIGEFGDRLRKGGVGLFYYSGHGMQVKGNNYLVPVDADIRSEAQVGLGAVNVNDVLGQMEEARNRINIVILDACRDNPFARRFRTAARGLASIDAPKGTLIAYATAPGSVADDGSGANGLYTEELLKAMSVPDRKIEDVFKQVRVGVSQRSGSKQIPWESTSLSDDFYFAGGERRDPGPAGPERRPEPPLRQADRQEIGRAHV